MKKFILVLLPVLLIGWMTVAIAQPPQPPMPPRGDLPMGHEWMGHPPMMPDMPQFGKMLDLTDEQKSKIEDYRLEMQKAMLPLRSQLMTNRNELKLLITADKVDRNKISQKIAATTNILKQIQEKRVDQLLKVRALLNADQKKKFDMKILSGRKGMRHGPRKMGHPGMKCGPRAKRFAK